MQNRDRKRSRSQEGEESKAKRHKADSNPSASTFMGAPPPIAPPVSMDTSSDEKTEIKTESPVEFIGLDFDETLALRHTRGLCLFIGEDNPADHKDYAPRLLQMLGGESKEDQIALQERKKWIIEQATAGKIIFIHSHGQKIKLVCSKTGEPLMQPFSSGKESVICYLNALFADDDWRKYIKPENIQCHQFSNGLVEKETLAFISPEEYEKLLNDIKKFRQKYLISSDNPSEYLTEYYAFHDEITDKIFSYRGRTLREKISEGCAQETEEKLKEILKKPELLTYKLSHIARILLNHFGDKLPHTIKSILIIDNDDDNCISAAAASDILAKVTPVIALQCRNDQYTKSNDWMAVAKVLQATFKEKDFSEETLKNIAKQACKPLLEEKKSSESKESPEALFLCSSEVGARNDKLERRSIYSSLFSDIILGNIHSVYYFLFQNEDSKNLKSNVDQLANLIIDAAPFASFLQEQYREKTPNKYRFELMNLSGDDPQERMIYVKKSGKYLHFKVSRLESGSVISGHVTDPNLASLPDNCELNELKPFLSPILDHVKSKTPEDTPRKQNPAASLFLLLSKLGAMAKHSLDWRTLQAWTRVLNDPGVASFISQQRKLNGGSLFNLRDDIFDFPHAFVQFVIEVMGEKPDPKIVEAVLKKQIVMKMDTNKNKKFFHYKLRHGFVLIQYLVEELKLELPKNAMDLAITTVLSGLYEPMTTPNERYLMVEYLAKKGFAIDSKEIGDQLVGFLLEGMLGPVFNEAGMLVVSALIERGAENVYERPKIKEIFELSKKHYASRKIGHLLIPRAPSEGYKNAVKANQADEDLVEDQEEYLEEDESNVRVLLPDSSEAKASESKSMGNMSIDIDLDHIMQWYDPSEKPSNALKNINTFHPIYKLIPLFREWNMGEKETPELIYLGLRFLSAGGDIDSFKEKLEKIKERDIKEKINYFFEIKESKEEKRSKNIEEMIASFSKESRFSLPKEKIEELAQQLKSIENHRRKLICETDAGLKDLLKEAIEKKDRCLLLAIIRERFYHATGILMNATQMLNVLALTDNDESLVAQIKTGEGKSAIIALCAAYRSMFGLKGHIITTHDHLAQRDAARMSTFFGLLGKTVGYCGKRGLQLPNTDIVYGQLDRFTSIYSNAVLGMGGEIPPLDKTFVIVDEFDRIALNEIASALHISLPIERYSASFLNEIHHYLSSAENLKTYEDYQNALLAYSKDNVAFSGYEAATIKALARSWCIARFEKKVREDFVVLPVDEKNKIYEIKIVDKKSTGEVKENVRWGLGLHSFVEIMQEEELKKQGGRLVKQADWMHASTMGIIAYLNKYSHISGVTGTAGTAANRHLYQQLYKNMKSYDSPTHTPCQRIKIDPVIVEDEKFDESLVKLASHFTEKKESAIIFCQTIKDSVNQLTLLRENKVDAQLLNHMQHEKAETVVERAGKFGKITVATSVMGRGADPSGSPDVVITYFPEDQREYEQLIGRTARHGRKGQHRMLLRKSDVAKMRDKLRKMDPSIPSDVTDLKVVDLFFAMQEKLDDKKMRQILHEQLPNILLGYMFERFETLPRAIRSEFLTQWGVVFSSVQDAALSLVSDTKKPEELPLKIIDIIQHKIQKFHQKILQIYPNFRWEDHENFRDLLINKIESLFQTKLKGSSVSSEVKMDLTDETETKRTQMIVEQLQSTLGELKGPLYKCEKASEYCTLKIEELKNQYKPMVEEKKESKPRDEMIFSKKSAEEIYQLAKQRNYSELNKLATVNVCDGVKTAMGIAAENKDADTVLYLSQFGGRLSLALKAAAAKAVVNKEAKDFLDILISKIPKNLVDQAVMIEGYVSAHPDTRKFYEQKFAGDAKSLETVKTAVARGLALNGDYQLIKPMLNNKVSDIAKSAGQAANVGVFLACGEMTTQLMLPDYFMEGLALGGHLEILSREFARNLDLSVPRKTPVGFEMPTKEKHFKIIAAFLRGGHLDLAKQFAREFKIDFSEPTLIYEIKETLKMCDTPHMLNIISFLPESVIKNYFRGYTKEIPSGKDNSNLLYFLSCVKTDAMRFLLLDSENRTLLPNLLAMAKKINYGMTSKGGSFNQCLNALLGKDKLDERLKKQEEMKGFTSFCETTMQAMNARLLAEQLKKQIESKEAEHATLTAKMKSLSEKQSLIMTKLAELRPSSSVMASEARQSSQQSTDAGLPRTARVNEGGADAEMPQAAPLSNVTALGLGGGSIFSGTVGAAGSPREPSLAPDVRVKGR